MSMQDLQQSLRLIEENRDQAHFAGPKSEELISLAESALGVSFPPTYKEFLRKLGCGGIAGEEFYGIVDSDFKNSSVPDGIWLTLEDRASGYLPPNLIVVYAVGEGTYYALDVSQTNSEGENPVVAWIPGASTIDDKLEIITQDFGEFILDRVTFALEPDNEI